MSFAKRVLALSLVLSLALITGCQERGGGQEDSSGTSLPPIQPNPQSAVEPVTSHEAEMDEPNSLPSEPEFPEEEEESALPYGGDVSDVDVDDESVAAAMSTDFSTLAQLDATPKPWGSGGPVDDKNRSNGALAYQELYGKYDAYFILPESDKVYLTFDEGYEYGYTPAILDTLKEKDVKAVFFLTHHFAKSESDLVRRMINEGHVLGNHSTKHPNFTTLPLSEAAKDIYNMHEYVKANFGYEMYLFRFPEGVFSEQLLAMVQSLGYKSIFWSFAYKDYDINDQPLTVEAEAKLIDAAHPGGLYLLHAVSRTNTEVLGNVIDGIRAKGFRLAKWDIY